MFLHVVDNKRHNSVFDKHADHYSRTKAIAEMKVLSANNSPVESEGDTRILRSCALRLAGVYGPGEERHLPRIVVGLLSISTLVW